VIPTGIDTPLRGVVGARTATVLERGLGLRTVGDLLYHLPRRYVSYGQVSDLRDLVIGEHATVVARVVSSEIVRTPNRKVFLKLQVGSGGETLDLAFFGRPSTVQYWSTKLAVGTRAMFDGKVNVFRGQRQLVNPRFELIEPDADDAQIEAVAARMLPIYPAAAKLASWSIAKAVQTVLPILDDDVVPDCLPAELRTARGWPSTAQALAVLHAPADRDQVELARERLTFEEAYVLQAALARRRAQACALPATPRPQSEGGLLADFDAALPFALTEGQREVGDQLAADLALAHPMQRLLQGEVGSGKTVVAVRAMLTVVDAGGQAALLAPTEVLAQQHYRSITSMMGDSTGVVLLTGSMGAKARREALAAIASGQAGLVIGTHALIQEGVRFADLGLVVVDEQHRFGVEQRDALRAKAFWTPHLLVMTATPIPRTVAMTVFGDLEVSTLRQLPGGRPAIASYVVPEVRPAWVKRCWARVREEIEAGRQGYVVCPAIEAGRARPQSEPDEVTQPWLELGSVPGPSRDRTSVTEVFERLQGEPELAGARLGVLHARLPAEEKDRVMAAFTAGEIDLLIATTMVEVGVDVANATVMVVMDATRFGISQLHQLRGRVGRGEHPSTCFFVAGAHASRQAVTLVEKVAATTDGFELAGLDLEYRREGDVLGSAQSGRLSSLRLLKVTKDGDIIAEARELAVALVRADPDLSGQPLLRAAIDRMLGPDREVFLDRG
jgi:ATP-dependent DNA helicase RecG